MALRELLAVFGVSVDDKELKSFDKNLDKVTSKVVGLGAAIAGVLAGGALAKFVGDTVEAGFQLQRTAAMLGVGTDELQAWRLSANLAGESTEKFDTALRFLLKNQGGAEAGLKAQVKEFQRLGVAAKDAHGNSVPLFDQVAIFADKLKGMSSQAQRTRVAMAVFGRSGAQILPWLLQGSAAIKQQLQDFKNLGGGMSKEFVEKAAKVAVQGRRVMFALTGLRAAAVEPLLESMEKWGDIIASDWIPKGIQLIRNSEIVKASLITLGGVALAFGGYMAIAFWPVTVGLAALIGIALVIDDLIVAMNGGKSVIGDYLAKYFGAEKAQKLIEGVKEAFEHLQKAAGEASPHLLKLLETMGLDVQSGLPVFIEGLTTLVNGLADSLNTAVRALQVFYGLAGIVYNGTKYLGNGAAALVLSAGAAMDDRAGPNDPDPADPFLDSMRQNLRDMGQHGNRVFNALNTPKDAPKFDQEPQNVFSYGPPTAASLQASPGDKWRDVSGPVHINNDIRMYGIKDKDIPKETVRAISNPDLYGNNRDAALTAEPGDLDFASRAFGD